MKKLTLTFLALLLFTAVNAQDWAPFHKKDIAHYSYEGDYQIANTIKVETESTNTGVTTNNFNKVIGKCNTCTHLDDYYINQPQFLGYAMEFKDGIYTFQGNDTFIINANIKQGGSWTFNFNSGITAEVVDQIEMNYLGVTDSVRVIALSNQDTIKLGKQLGIISFGYNQLKPLVLVGEESRVIGEHVPTFKDFFNYKVGDALLYKYEYKYLGGRGPFFTYYFRYLIADILHSSKDSVVYEVDMDGYVRGAGTGGTTKYKILTKRTKLAFVAKGENKHTTDYFINELVKDYPSRFVEVGFIPESHYDEVIKHSFISEKPALNQVIKSEKDGGFYKVCGNNDLQMHYNESYYNILEYMDDSTFFHINQASLPRIVYDEDDVRVSLYSSNVIYKESIGVVGSYVSFENDIETLIYYSLSLIAAKIDGVTEFGELSPHGFFKLGAENLPLTDNVVIYPNPATNQVTINVYNYLGRDAEVKIYNTSGQIVIAEEHDFTTGSLIIDIANLPAGIYYVKVLNNSIVGTKKLVIN